MTNSQLRAKCKRADMMAMNLANLCHEIADEYLLRGDEEREDWYRSAAVSMNDVPSNY